MMSLIYKDLKAFHNITLFHLLMVLMVMSFGIFIDHNGTLTVLMLIIYPMSLPTILLLYDTQYERLILSLPVTRYHYVLSKYIGGICSALLVIVIGLLYSSIISKIKTSIDFNPLYSITSVFILSLPVVVSASFLFPLYFRFSKAKASGILMGVFACFLIASILGLVSLEKTLETSDHYAKEDIFPVITGAITNYMTQVGPKVFLTQVVLSVCTLLALSIGLSLVFIAKKDIGDPS